MKNFFTITILLISLASIFNLSCKDALTLNQEHSFDHESWSSQDTIHFKWTIPDTSLWYSMELVVQHKLEFPFQNQYVMVHTLFPDQHLTEQLLSLELYDDTGRPFGKCNGSLCNTPLLLQEKVKFPQIGAYQIDLMQNGRDTVVNGLSALRLKIQKI